MTILRNSRFLALAACGIFSFSPLPAIADDIDIYTGSSGGSAVAPRVILMVDNTQTSDQNFPNKMAAIKNAVAALAAEGIPIEVGLGLFNPATASHHGAYVRFSPRDITVPANLAALNNIITGPMTDGQKDEPEMFYELGQFFTGQLPWAGNPSSSLSTSPSLVPLADTPGNTNSYTGAKPGTVVGTPVGMTTGFAYAWDAVQSKWTYNSPASNCARNFIIYITTDNTFSPSQVQGSQCYNGVCAGSELTGSKSDGLTGYWGDEWAEKAFTSGNQIVTYAIDAAIGGGGGADATFTKVIQAMADAGGGKYSGQLTTTAQFTNILLQYLHEILAVNSTFASASLPINTSNRGSDKNQVFIPMFRPDGIGLPLWRGNLKQYQLINSGNSVVLGDSAGQPASNPVTGFATDCAVSYWTTTPSSASDPWYDYWTNVNDVPRAQGKCATSTHPWAESPDGPFVEKGGIAEVIRNGNNPPTTSNSPTMGFNRAIYTSTLTGNAFTSFDTTNTTLTTALGGGATATGVVNFIRGLDVNAEYTGRLPSATATLTRPSIHGDVVHSRPLPVDYGGATGVRVFYGANDGMFRSVDASSGKELWAFVAPEHWSQLARLKANLPLIQYPSFPAGTGTAKDYFFDGATGLYQTSGNSKVWIYPSMRRGGRMFYAFDVTSTSAAPSIKWKVGCPNLNNDTNCAATMSAAAAATWSAANIASIGQTWSTPNPTSALLGYSGPVVIVGGGYDSCEDADNIISTGCSGSKGAAVFVIDADTGALIKSFPTNKSRGVAADVALISVATAGVVDHAYVADTGGNIFRIDFSANKTDWTMNRVAYTNGSGRKFLFSPALVASAGNSVFVAIGSGDREHPLKSQYPYSNVVNRFYVYRDDLAATSANNLDDTTIVNDVSTDPGCNSQSLAGSTKKGWFMNFGNGTGEQTVTSAIVTYGMVFFSTNRPIPAAQGTCALDLGEARGYSVNLLNGSGTIGVPNTCGGTRSATFAGGGLAPTPVFGIVPIGGKDTVVVIGGVQREGGTSCSTCAQSLSAPVAPTRKSIYWKSSGEN